MRYGSAPNFAPPTEEGIIIPLEDENGEVLNLEFLGLIVEGDTRFGFFFEVDEQHPSLSNGEVIVLEVTELDEDGQPCSFELIEDEAVALQAYEKFKVAAKDLYDFE